MIGRLRRKLIIVMMGATSIILAVVFFATNMFNYKYLQKNADDMLTLIAENNGVIPEFPEMLPNRHQIPESLSRESVYQTRYFIVQYDKLNNIIDVNRTHIAAVSDMEAAELANAVLKRGALSGYSGIYRFKSQLTDFGRIIIFLDCSIQLKSALSMVFTSCFIALACILAIFIVICIFSRRFLKPMIDNIEKQKRFITDAGHELKTPLAIINANVEVMEIMSGSNEWLESVKNQVKRLDQLVKSMLQLAKMEEGTLSPVLSDFDLSSAFSEITEPFKTMASQKGKTLWIHTQPGVRMNGDEGSIRNLISILVDNAIKYCSDDGTIDAALTRDGKNIKIKVRNSSNAQNGGSLERLFDRFYRPDDSRARETGGFGIGLSMAKTIVDAHKGKISAKYENGGYVSFNVVFKTNIIRNKK